LGYASSRVEEVLFMDVDYTYLPDRPHPRYPLGHFSPLERAVAESFMQAADLNQRDLERNGRYGALGLPHPTRPLVFSPVFTGADNAPRPI
jgi:hypothetical protein